jgi:hypothetical protein
MGIHFRVCDPRNMLPRGLEPRTLRLLAVRSDQLSYKSQRRGTRHQSNLPNLLGFNLRHRGTSIWSQGNSGMGRAHSEYVIPTDATMVRISTGADLSGASFMALTQSRAHNRHVLKTPRPGIEPGSSA